MILTFAFYLPYGGRLLEGRNMDARGLFLKFWEQEAKATRSVIARIPEGSNYRPDPKSRTAKDIAWVIVREETALVDGLEKGTLEWQEIPPPATVKEVLAAYDKLHQSDVKRLNDIPAARWGAQVPMTFEGKEVMKQTGSDTAWGFLVDIIHHRGQLSTYLRPMGSTVPQIYGPTADEP